MSNTTIQIAQNFTGDHALAAKAIRLPRGALSAMDSPYLSLISLVKGWPEQNVRREVHMITDGIDRLRDDANRQQPAIAASTARGRTMPSSTSTFRTMPSISTDADTASMISQQFRVIVHSIYSTGVGKAGRNAWEAQLGQSGISKIADETGGEYFALGTREPLSFKPYLDRLQRIFENQYFLVFQAFPGKKAELKRVKITTDPSERRDCGGRQRLGACHRLIRKPTRLSARDGRLPKNCCKSGVIVTGSECERDSSTVTRIRTGDSCWAKSRLSNWSV